MRTLFIDMPAGVAGDMLRGALVGAGADLGAIGSALDGLGVGRFALSASQVRRGSLMGHLVRVAAPPDADWSGSDLPHLELGAAQPAGERLAHQANASTKGAAAAARHGEHGGHEHGHRPYRDIRALIARAGLPERARARAQAAFLLLAEAEGAVHGVPAEQVAFHEVGSLDAIADVVGACLALEQLGIDRVVASALVPGQGTVRCAHGEMPVPVPAVADMLARRSAPVRLLGWETGELTTPTGCALVLALADAFVGASASPTLTGTLVAQGFGAGMRDPQRLANVVRVAILAESVPAGGLAVEQLVEASFQVDDATGEALAVLLADVLEAGALDAWLTPVVMKKGRPGHLVSVLARPENARGLTTVLLERSSTLGVRWHQVERTALPREMRTVAVDGHAIRVKVARLPGGGVRAKPEADDVAAAARALGRPFTIVSAEALAAWQQEPPI